MTEKKLLCKAAFIGTAYCGYQCQKNGRTIQEEINRAANTLFGYPCDITGCSRTDSGVHANMFCLTIIRKGKDFLETNIPVERIPLALTAHLPSDISVYDATWVKSDFHPRYGVISKEYEYLIWNHPVRSPFMENRAYHFPHVLDDEAICRMNRACADLVGRHDFFSFMAQGSKVISTERFIISAKIAKDDNVLKFIVSADGFLYNMVRIMAGTLLEIGRGVRGKGEIPGILAGHDRRLAGVTLPAHGLYLNRVVYPENMVKW